MFVGLAVYESARSIRDGAVTANRSGERGAAVVEWLGISALSIGLLVVIFQGMEALGIELVASIRSQLGL